MPARHTKLTGIAWQVVLCVPSLDLGYQEYRCTTMMVSVAYGIASNGFIEVDCIVVQEICEHASRLGARPLVYWHDWSCTEGMVHNDTAWHRCAGIIGER